MKGWKDEIKGVVHLRVNKATVEKEVDGQWTVLVLFTTEVRYLDDLGYNRVGVVVAPSKEAPERNGYLIDYEGKILWQIEQVWNKTGAEPSPIEYPYDHWVGFGYEDGKLLAKTQGAFVYEIDPATGIIIQFIRYTKF